MTPTTLRGMAWDHPRAYRPLEAFAATAVGPGVRWDRQPLADFEARPIGEVADDHDLLVIDHPGLGAAIESNALLPLEDVVDPDVLAGWSARAVGPTWDSYTVDGRQWAVPIDAATQVSVMAAGLSQPVPRSWCEVASFVAEVPTTLCLGGPHALLMLLAMTASDRHPVDGRPGADLLDRDAAVEALCLLQRLWQLVDRDVSGGDPVEVHEAVAAGRVSYCPLAYGYAAYARPAAGALPLRWSDAPASPAGRPGTVLGGTGLAVSARSGGDLDQVRRFLGGFLDAEVQTGLVPDHSGQPADRAAWDDPRLDEEWGGYYSGTRASLEAAVLRPRVAGWIDVQTRAGALVRDAVTGGSDPGTVVDQVNEAYADSAGRRAGAGSR
jgi:multiple sugar transport system substrate-binding protein